MTRAYIAFLIFALVLISPFIVSAASGTMGDTALAPTVEEFKATDGIAPEEDECVRDREEMLSDHMVLLKDARVEIVHEGGEEVREEYEELEVERCFSCHEFDNFCKECHEYNGVKPTCFNETGGCHANDNSAPELTDPSNRPEL